MGYEAQVLCDMGTQRETVKALLESQELLLRGAIRKRFAIAELAHPRVTEGALVFETVDGNTVSLHLGAEIAQKWLRKIQTPPPSLAAKLGISAEQPAVVLGDVPDEVLAEALRGAVTDNAQSASVLIAIVRTPADVSAALQRHSTMSCRGLWLIHEKGPKAAVPDAQIRATMHAHDYKDHKISGVSTQWTATRYARPGAENSRT